MKKAAMTLCMIIGISGLAFAGKVTGNVSDGGKPVAKDTKVEVTCGANTVSAMTDAYGAFSLFIADKGKCALKVHYQGQTPTLEITSYDNSVQYDLILEKQGVQYALRRK